MLRSAPVWLLIACAAQISCQGDAGPAVPADIAFSPSSVVVLGQGLQEKLFARVVDAEGRVIPQLKPTLTSLDPSTVTVSDDGVVTSVGPLRNTEITAEYAGIIATAGVIVTQRAVSLVITPDAVVINRNAQAQLNITAHDFIGNLIVSQISYESLDPTMLAVTPTGRVIAGAQTGTTGVEVTVAGLVDTVPVTITIIPGSITVAPLSVVLEPNGQRDLTVVVKDVVGGLIAGVEPSFNSTAPGLFEVSDEGEIHAFGAEGSGTVRVSYQSLVGFVGVLVATRPQGLVAATTMLTGSPYAAAVGGPARDVVVSRVSSSSVARGTLPETTLPVTIDAGPAPHGVSIDPTGTRAYVAATSEVEVINLTSNTTLAPITGLEGQVYDVKQSLHGDIIYAATATRVYRIDAVTQLHTSVPAAFATWLAVHPTLPRVYVTYLNAAAVAELDAETLQEQRRFIVGGVVQGLALGPGGMELFVAVEDGSKLQVWELAGGTRTQEVSLGTRPFGVAVVRQYIVVTGSQFFGGAGRIELLDVSVRTPVRTLEVGGTPRRPGVDSEGTVVVIPNEAGWVDFVE